MGCDQVLEKVDDLSAVEQTVRESGAGIVVFVRPSNSHTDDPHNTEPRFCDKLRGILTVSTLVVISRRLCASKPDSMRRWQNVLKEDKAHNDEINFVPVPDALVDQGGKYELTSEALDKVVYELAENWSECEDRMAVRKRRV